jgi:hypothetical protein
MERVEFKPGRGNLIIRYPGTTDKVVSFVGSHLDVVSVATAAHTHAHTLRPAPMGPRRV